jgi:ATP-dependent Lon protease
MANVPVVAGFHDVFKMEELRRAITQADGSTNTQLTRVLQRLATSGTQRYLVKPWSPTTLDWLYGVCPNFSPVIDELRRHLALAIDSDQPLCFMPLLLAGDPGVGKTYFSKCLAQALATEMAFVSMGSVSGGFLLGGLAPSWHGARFGKVAGVFVEGKIANPIFLIDEIDKTAGDARYDPFGTLLQLLEPETSRHFRDEFLDLEFDCSKFLWVATANDLSRVPDYILSRMAVHEVVGPTVEQARQIAQRVYEGLVTEHGFKMQPDLSDDVLDTLSNVAPREMRKRLLQAMGEAKLDGRNVLRADDVRKTQPRPARAAIGFIS